MFLRIGALALIAVVAVELPARAQTFEFTVRQFVDRYNETLRASEADTVRNCKPVGGGTRCTFTDEKFQMSVKAFKELNLANGRFNLVAELLIETERDRVVASILVVGNRADPMNLFHFVGRVGNLIKTLKPGMSDDDSAKVTSQLGLMRGDSDPTIGEAQVAIEDFAAIKCNNQLSAVSTRIGCAFVPRS